MTYSAEYQWRAAAQWAGYKQEEFEELDGWRQSIVVALYETDGQIKSILGEEASKPLSTG